MSAVTNAMLFERYLRELLAEDIDKLKRSVATATHATLDSIRLSQGQIMGLDSCLELIEEAKKRAENHYRT